MQLNLKNDIVFKAFFGHKGNEKFLTEFLEALLKIKIHKIEIQEEVNLEKLFREEKGGRLDLLATLNDGIKVNIEMQVRKQADFLERTMLYYIKENAREIGTGIDFGKIKRTIMINILDFEIFENIQDYLSETAIVLKNHREYEIMQNQKWYFIELPKFRRVKSNLNDKLEQWLLFIDDYKKGEIEMVEKKNKTLKEAREKVNYLTGDAEIKRITELREKWEIERKWDEEAAKKEGKQEEKIEIAKKLLKKGIRIEELIEITGLTKEEIEDLK